MDQRNRLQSQEPSHPNINSINQEIDRFVQAHKRNKWLKFLNGEDRKSRANKLWSTIRNLNSSEGKSNASKISFGTITLSIPKKSANLFNRQFTPHPPTIYDSKRAVLRRIRQLPKESVEYTTNGVFETIRFMKKQGSWKRQPGPHPLPLPGAKCHKIHQAVAESFKKLDGDPAELVR